MSDTMTREDRRSALDDFAHNASTDSSQALVTVTRAAVPEAVYGSREVSTRRDEATVLQKIRVLAAAAGSDWYYRYPVKNRKKGTTDWIEGVSIGGALDVARLYGNCHVDCRAEDFGNVILYHARFHDVESGFSLTRPFQQRKGAAKLGGDDAGRRDEIDFSIGASKAIRNVVTNGLKTYCRFALEEAKGALVDKIGKNLERWKADTVDKLKIDLPRVEAVIGRPVGAWLAADVAKVRAMGTAIEEGMATWDEAFPPLGGKTEAPAKEALDQFADERSMVGGTGTVASSGAKAGAGAKAPSPDPAPAPRQEIIDKLLRLAADKGSAGERLEVLEVTKGMLEGLYTEPDDAAFVKQAVINTAKVINGDMSPPLARQYLEGLIK